MAKRTSRTLFLAPRLPTLAPFLFALAPSFLRGGVAGRTCKRCGPTSSVACRAWNCGANGSNCLTAIFSISIGQKNSRGPIVIVLHGLEGSSDSKYARGLLKAVHDHGWRGVVMHFRGCSGEPNRLPRSYHSGETTDLAYVVKLLQPAANPKHRSLSSASRSAAMSCSSGWGKPQPRHPCLAALASIPSAKLAHKHPSRPLSRFPCRSCSANPPNGWTRDFPAPTSGA